MQESQGTSAVPKIDGVEFRKRLSCLLAEYLVQGEAASDDALISLIDSGAFVLAKFYIREGREELLELASVRLREQYDLVVKVEELRLKSFKSNPLLQMWEKERK